MKHTHLVTSGCSFTAWTEPSWAHWLSIELNVPLYNFGCPSAGNSWISKTAIYGTQQLLDAGVPPDEILVAVMWSGIDRKDMFISADTPGYRDLLNSQNANPVKFLGRDMAADCGWHTTTTDGYLLGSMGCSFINEYINTFKRSLIRDYYCDEALAIESFENFLRVQWYCQSKKIRLVNLTYTDIMHYPNYYYTNVSNDLPRTSDHFKNVKPLNDMIDFTNWIFWNDTGGLYEYVRDLELPFLDDGFHPGSPAAEHFVKNFLLGRICY